MLFAFNCFSEFNDTFKLLFETSMENWVFSGAIKIPKEHYFLKLGLLVILLTTDRFVALSVNIM